MASHDDTALSYLYGRFSFARQMMTDPDCSRESRRDWAMRAEELRQCLRNLEQWRAEEVGSRYESDDVTAMEILPPREFAYY
ncbi:hypothetical protein EIL87_15325 [Saccharopolyspora rhizosphaerae]|uniref:Uncharacterized protein n=1 Tax=Saccharopolyspora rhizosphaerae TaxID=2492662 RepID=A0A426JQG9_9PSEU|nr:hypothetical protein [Saccharopolyspora rhizosphaerae]RRO15434.1 hypothetical protein EIL87_15325 [Saccharopolyspora rhizosphaerae]